MDIKIKALKEIKTITIHNVNKNLLSEVSLDLLDSLDVSIDETDSIQLTIPKYVMVKGNKVKYVQYEDVKEERLICINDVDYYVIKKIKEKHEKDNKYKVVSAYSLEHKLGRVDIEVEDVGFYLKSKDEENGIYSLDEYMQKEVGWKFGYISDKVLGSGDNLKMRWQESVNTNWYDYINKNVREQFECIPFFITKTKTIELYHADDFGDKIVMALSYDGYLKSLEKESSSEDIVTRLKLVGNEEMDIIGATPSGYKYIEDYSYFIENKEMSSLLISHIEEYERMVKKRTPVWEQLVENKLETSKNLNDKKMELFMLFGEINANESKLKVYNLADDVVNAAKVLAELSKQKDEKFLLDRAVTALDVELNQINESIDRINILCKRETCTDDNGHIIFTKDTLEELKNFLYYDTYTEDAFLDVKDLLSAGRTKLDILCKPTLEIDIDIIDFTSRIIDNGFNNHFKAELDLGNIIALVDDEDNEYLRYFVGFKKNFKNNSLSLTISNKKGKSDNSKLISQWLSESRRNMKQIKTSRYLWTQQKKNRINLKYKKGE